MATATLTSKGQITLPKIVRDELGLSAGTTVDFVRTAEGFKLVVIGNDIANLKGRFANSAKRSISLADMDTAIAKGVAGRLARSKS